jgi:heme/copper-type cytochrome/quinol oxidase subunit 2
MRLLILALCALLVSGVSATAVLTLWSTRESAARPAAFRHSLAAEFVWTAIPGLMLLAASIPAVLAIVAAHSE